MTYRLIRISLEKSIKAFQWLHKKWLRLPFVIMPSKSYKRIQLFETDAKLLHSIAGGKEAQFFPKIHKLSLGGEIYTDVEPIELWRCNDASFTYRSNFIRLKDGCAFNTKLELAESIFSLPADLDLIYLNDAEVRLTKKLSKIKYQNVLHLAGVNSNNWAHFLAEYFPKLALIEYAIADVDELNIVLFEGTDSHIIELVKRYVSRFNKVKIVFVPIDYEIFAHNLYYIKNNTYISDDGLISNIFRIKLSDHNIKFLLDYGSNLALTNVMAKNSRVFIGRGAKRGIVNYAAVLENFSQYGFVEVFPHLMTFDEKINLFSNAEYIAGPLSSGFANMIFSQKLKEVIMMTNCSRHDDMYITKIVKFMKVDCEYIIGEQTDSISPDSDFKINIDDLSEFLESKLGG